MTRDEIREAIEAELAEARGRWSWEGLDIVHRAAIVTEEAGELLRAALRHYHEQYPAHDATREAIQTAAMCLRFLEEE